MANYHRIIWIIILNILHLCYAGDIICANARDQNCFKKTLNCISDGTDCVVTCSGDYACKESIINCAPDVKCFVNCLKFQSCENIVINGGYATTLSVNNINSDAQQALINGEINCQNVPYCDVTCNDEKYQCANVEIKAKQAGQLVVRCSGNNQYTYHCQGLNIYCPKAQQKCWIFSPIVLSQIDIFSEFGFDGVALCGDTNDKPIGNMHCGLEYQSSCTINTFAVNYCDSASVCDATNTFTDCNPPLPSLSNATKNPTTITISPTFIPTIMPSFHPTEIPTNSPTNNGTKTEMILATKSNTVFDLATFTIIMSILILLGCLIMLKCVKMRRNKKSNNVNVKENNVNDNELQQLTVPGNNELILNASNEGNTQHIEEMSDDIYEGIHVQTGAIEVIQTNKQSLSVSLGLNALLPDETVIDTSSDEHLEVFGPGCGDCNAHSEKDED